MSTQEAVALMEAGVEIGRLKALNASLVAALGSVMRWHEQWCSGTFPPLETIRAALAKAKETAT